MKQLKHTVSWYKGYIMYEKFIVSKYHVFTYVCVCVCTCTCAHACMHIHLHAHMLQNALDNGGSWRGQEWQARWRSRPHWVSWKLIPSMVEKTWRVSVYVGMVSGVFSVIITRCPPVTGSPGSLCSETSRRKRQNQRERRRKKRRS